MRSLTKSGSKYLNNHCVLIKLCPANGFLWLKMQTIFCAKLSLWLPSSVVIGSQIGFPHVITSGSYVKAGVDADSRHLSLLQIDVSTKLKIRFSQQIRVGHQKLWCKSSLKPLSEVVWDAFEHRTLVMWTVVQMCQDVTGNTLLQKDF